MKCQETSAVLKQIHLQEAEAFVNHKNQKQQTELLSKLIVPIIVFFMNNCCYVVIINPLEKEYVQ